MEKIVGDWSTEVKMTAEEAKTICKLGDGESTCAFLVVGGNGFECIKMSYPANGSIHSRLKDGTMTAKGEGKWEGCAWK